MFTVEEICEEQERQYNQLMQEDDQYCHPESFKWGFEHGFEYALSKFGWHPASEPPTIPDGKSAVEIVVLYTQKDGQLYSTQIRFPKWDKWEELNKYNQVKWWCYSPKEE